MSPILAQITTSQSPTFFAIGAGFVGLLGVITAIVAYASISKDRSAIRRAETMLASEEAWVDAGTHSDHELSEWMRSRSIHPESGVADIIRACWSAWVASRATSLTELHVLVARRERSKIPARLSGGIAALLLIIGIVGTLFSVHPILKAFQFRVSASQGTIPSGDAPLLSNVTESTELVNTLMHGLGDAFIPSLTALIATIAVVIFRGIYSLNLHRYTLELDRFAMGIVMPHFRPRSIADEYADVRSTFNQLAKTIGERDARFEVAVARLIKFADGLEPALNGQREGIAAMTTAAESLASKSNSIATTLTRNLGEKSPLYRAVSGFESIFANANQQLENLSDHIEGIRSAHLDQREAMKAALADISVLINRVSVENQQDRESALKAVIALESVVTNIPTNLLDSTRKTFDAGMVALRTKFSDALVKQTEESSVTHLEIRSKSQETLDLISKSLTRTSEDINSSLKAIPEMIDRLNESLKVSSNAEKAALRAIDSLTREAKEGIRRASGSAKNLPPSPDSAPQNVTPLSPRVAERQRDPFADPPTVRPPSYGASGPTKIDGPPPAPTGRPVPPDSTDPTTVPPRESILSIRPLDSASSVESPTETTNKQPPDLPPIAVQPAPPISSKVDQTKAPPKIWDRFARRIFGSRKS